MVLITYKLNAFVSISFDVGLWILIVLLYNQLPDHSISLESTWYEIMHLSIMWLRLIIIFPIKVGAYVSEMLTENETFANNVLSYDYFLSNSQFA